MIVTPAVHYSGVWFSDFLPLSDNSVHDNTGATYNVTRILNSQGTFDEAAYKAYSPLFLSTTFAISYGISFAAVLSIVVHVALYHGQDLWLRLKMARDQEDDIHMRLMKKYRDAPDWYITQNLFDQYFLLTHMQVVYRFVCRHACNGIRNMCSL